MLGAIAGDVVGSPYEFEPIKTTEFPLFGPSSAFTDDTVLTCAVAEALLGGGDYAAAFRRWGRRYPDVSWGGRFRQWLSDDRAGPYGSFGNGSAMRVGPVGWARDTVEEVLAEAERSARPTHDHPEGIKGAQATALAVFLARTGAGKGVIREEIARRFGYDVWRSVDAVRPSYRFDETCQRTVPEALIAFFDSTGLRARGAPRRFPGRRFGHARVHHRQRGGGVLRRRAGRDRRGDAGAVDAGDAGRARAVRGRVRHAGSVTTAG